MAITDKDVEKLKGVFATKDDLKGFATKDDLKGFATKEDLQAAIKASENRVVEFLDHIVKQNETIKQEITGTHLALRRHEDKLENHEGRIKTLEAAGVA